MVFIDRTLANIRLLHISGCQRVCHILQNVHYRCIQVNAFK